MYGKNIEKKCIFCEYSAFVVMRGELICSKKGIVSPEGKCIKFKYDPLKRDIRPKPKLHSYDQDDFKI